MAAIRNALVVGGGFSGMAAAVELAKAGVKVDLVEIDPKWRPEGAGISISGATLRALETLGVYEQVTRSGHVADGVELRAPHGVKVGEIPPLKVAGSDVGSDAGILRSELARLLAEATRRAGVDVRAGCTYEALEDDGAQVNVRFTDGTQRGYDLVVGAEGLRSKLREKLFPEAAAPRYVGQVVWRALFDRPPEIVAAHHVGRRRGEGGRQSGVGDAHVYVSHRDPLGEEPAGARELAGHHRGAAAPVPRPPVQALIPQLTLSQTAIDYRPLANLLVPAPWNRGRVVLIGDAVHATTPHLASGAGIGIESAIVLAEEIGRARDSPSALDAFHARRFERVPHGDREFRGAVPRSRWSMATCASTRG